MSNDVEFVSPVELPFTDGDLKVMIRPANVAQLTKMLRLAKPLVDEIVLLPPDMLDRAVAGEPTNGDLAHMLELVCDRAEMAAQLVAVATGIDLARVEGLLPDRFVYLVALVVEVNADFFGRSAAAWTGAKALVQAAVAKSRAQPAPGSTLSTS